VKKEEVRSEKSKVGSEKLKVKSKKLEVKKVGILGREGIAPLSEGSRPKVEASPLIKVAPRNEKRKKLAMWDGHGTKVPIPINSYLSHLVNGDLFVIEKCVGESIKYGLDFCKKMWII